VAKFGLPGEQLGAVENRHAVVPSPHEIELGLWPWISTSKSKHAGSVELSLRSQRAVTAEAELWSRIKGALPAKVTVDGARSWKAGRNRQVHE
jgi:hypothetical protein